MNYSHYLSINYDWLLDLDLIFFFQFAAALLIIFVIELAVGIAAAVFKNDFSMAMKDTLKESMKNYTDADKFAWDNVQNKVGRPNLEHGEPMMALSIE